MLCRLTRELVQNFAKKMELKAHISRNSNNSHGGPARSALRNTALNPSQQLSSWQQPWGLGIRVPGFQTEKVGHGEEAQVPQQTEPLRARVRM